MMDKTIVAKVVRFCGGGFSMGNSEDTARMFVLFLFKFPLSSGGSWERGIGIVSLLWSGVIWNG